MLRLIASIYFCNSNSDPAAQSAVRLCVIS